MSSPQDFESLVQDHYRDLYHFAYSLTRAESEASDLVQETFHIWARKGSQLRELRSAKSWLFTTLHREFLQARRHQTRFPEVELDDVQEDLPLAGTSLANTLDAATVLAALGELAVAYRAPLALYYLQDYSYREIADVLDVPLGTVQSRIARGKARLLEMLTGSSERKENPEPSTGEGGSHE
jgi:RNA polymerase sigma-70 factor (ECF subfamily)